MKEQMRNYLYYFKYCDHPVERQADPDTTFFTFDGEKARHDEEKLEQLFGRFKQVNAEGLTRVLRGDKGEFKFNENCPVDSGRN